jgi:hypothetical protein
LENCPELWSLNLSNNYVERIEGLSACKKLAVLHISRNNIGINGVEDLEELPGLSEVATLDVQENRISEADVIPEVLMRMPQLACLYLKGNDVAKKIPNYRKSVIVNIPSLTYLDDRPVFTDDRRAAVAFNRGGLEEERAERRRIRAEKDANHDRNMLAFQNWIERSKLEKREQEAMRMEDKYSETEDPGLEKERQVSARLDQWKRDNAEALRDDNLERAKRCLANEKIEADKKVEGGSSGKELDQRESKPARLEKELSNVTPEPKEDTRKLVYEDIWDDPPPIGPATSSSACPVSCISADGFAPAATFEGPRPGWYFGTGDRGTGYYKDKQSGRKCAPSFSDTVETMPAVAAPVVQEEIKKGWYSNYHANIKAREDEIQRRIDAGRAAKAERKEFLNAAARGLDGARERGVDVDGAFASAASQDSSTRLPFNPPSRSREEGVAGAGSEYRIGQHVVADTPALYTAAASDLHDMD